MSTQTIDPVTLTILNNNFVNVCREMGITMARTAFSPIFNEGLDFSCVLFDRRGRPERADRVAARCRAAGGRDARPLRKGSHRAGRRRADGVLGALDARRDR